MLIVGPQCLMSPDFCKYFICSTDTGSLLGIFREINELDCCDTWQKSHETIGGAAGIGCWACAVDSTNVLDPFLEWNYYAYNIESEFENHVKTCSGWDFEE